MVKGVTIVNRSVCLLGPLFSAYWFISSSLHSVYLRQSLSLFLILNKDRKLGHEGTLESHGSQVLPFVLGSDKDYYERSSGLHGIQWTGGARQRKCLTRC